MNDALFGLCCAIAVLATLGAGLYTVSHGIGAPSPTCPSAPVTAWNDPNAPGERAFWHDANTPGVRCYIVQGGIACLCAEAFVPVERARPVEAP